MLKKARLLTRPTLAGLPTPDLARQTLCRRTRLVPSKVAEIKEVRRTLRYVEPPSDVRTPTGEKRLSARRGWAGERSDFFSILLEV